jgi:streptomycin 6-kinase
VTSGPSRLIDVPAIVQAHAASVPGGAAWLAGLPRLLTAVERQWAVTITGWLPGGTTSVVARATTGEGRAVVIKVAVPGSWFGEQVRTLAAADGNGYVRLLAYDSGRHAALLEALGPSLHVSGLPPSAQLSILGRLVRRAWRRPASPDQARDKAAELAELVQQLWEQLGHPCSYQVVEQALTCARRRSAAFDPAGGRRRPRRCRCRQRGAGAGAPRRDRGRLRAPGPGRVRR